MWSASTAESLAKVGSVEELVSEQSEEVVAAERDWQAETVLVTGGSGFIGQHLLERLVDAGCRPVSVSRSIPTRFSAGTLEDTVDWRAADLSSASDARSLLEEVSPDVVFHLAGVVKGTRERSAVLPMLEGNVRQAITLMDAAVECGCKRFIQAGSLEEPDDLNSTPASPYAVSKLAASAYARLYREHYGLSTAVARIFMVYGPGVQDENKLVPYVIKSLLAGTKLELTGGSRPVDWVMVSDVASGLMALADSSETVAELGSGELHSVREVVEKLYRALGLEADLEVNSPFGTLEDRAKERVCVADLRKNTRLGWTPTVSLEEGLAGTVAWFK